MRGHLSWMTSWVPQSSQSWVTPTPCSVSLYAEATGDPMGQLSLAPMTRALTGGWSPAHQHC